jgi:hypothetical protein
MCEAASRGPAELSRPGENVIIRRSNYSSTSLARLRNQTSPTISSPHLQADPIGAGLTSHWSIPHESTQWVPRIRIASQRLIAAPTIGATKA